MGFLTLIYQKMVISRRTTIEEKRMWRFKFKYLILGFITAYSLVAIASHPAFAQENTATTEFVLFYRNEFTFLLCVITMALGTWLGMKLPADKEEEDLPQSIKFVTALLGGILAFIYCLYKDNSLTLLNPIWIAMASIVLPVTILSLRTKFKGYTKNIDLPKNGD